MCGSMADIQSAAAEIRREKKEELECGPMPNLMVALWNRADHYIFALWLLLLLFFPRLISAFADWMSAILPHMVRPQCEFKMQV